MVERVIEELTLNAWPARRTLLYDGWVLRLADGYTRRANSTSPLYPSRLPLPDKIAACEAVYGAHGQDTIFKLSSAAELLPLDAELERVGYRREAPTSVQTCDLAERALGLDAAVRLAPELDERWLDDFLRLGGANPRHRPTIQALLAASGQPRAFATLWEGGEVLALGLAVAERDYVGLFDIVVAAQARGRGLGRRLVGHLLARARGGGARTAHLSVMDDNTPALRLYASLGFTTAYRYWYRVKPLSDAERPRQPPVSVAPA